MVNVLEHSHQYPMIRDKLAYQRSMMICAPRCWGKRRMVQRLLHASGRSTSARFMISSRDFATVGGIDYAAPGSRSAPSSASRRGRRSATSPCSRTPSCGAQRQPHAGRGRHRWGPPRQRDAAL